MLPKSSCSGSNVCSVRFAFLRRTTPTAKQTAKRIAIATSDRRPPRRRSAPIAIAASAVNGIARRSGRCEPEEHPERDPAEGRVGEAVAEVGEAARGHEDAEQREQRGEDGPCEERALEDRDREIGERVEHGRGEGRAVRQRGYRHRRRSATLDAERPIRCACLRFLDFRGPYLVVAADKGTGSFSDVANELADEYGYWLGDEFASGGSAGFDHKEMAITSQGAWISVRAHFRALGVDADTAPLRVVGIGDMSGDVFGNGLLRSPHLRLIAAFDHRHVFVDPDPDPAASFAERQRLFELPASSWADYNPMVLSAGGGCTSAAPSRSISRPWHAPARRPTTGR